MLPLMEDAIVARRHWLEPTEFLDAVALSEVVPGPVTLKVAAYMGFLLRGYSGLLVSTLCFALPSIVLVLAGCIFWFHYGATFPWDRTLRFVEPIVLAAFLATTLRLGRRSVNTPFQIAIAVAAFLAMRAKISPLVIMVGAGFLGILYATWSGKRMRR